MKNIKTYKVIPNLPKELSALEPLAYNLYWSWNFDIQNLFRRLDRDLWHKENQNPVRILSHLNQEKLDSRATDDGYLSHLSRAKETLEKYINKKNWFKKNHPTLTNLNIAYFSMEYGLTSAMPVYSGGLGILAGDHLKSASDLGLPLIGVGLLYQNGYFQQYLTNDGWQQEHYPTNDFFNLPITLIKLDDNTPLMISVDFPGRKVHAQVWKCIVGRITLYMLDTNISINSVEDQKITDRLYGGDTEKRIQQEILLGIGGIRALDALGINPQVCHMNEGHSAFMALERAKQLMERNQLSFVEAHESTRGGNVFTSHTPVPAGIDEFDPELVDRYLGSYYNTLNLDQGKFHTLGGVNLPQTKGKFNMAIFALNMAGYCNGVSNLHGHVARKMWHYLYPDFPVEEVPIKHVTNGVHIATWLSDEFSELYNYYLGDKWSSDPTDKDVWLRINNIPDEELWRAHERRREILVAFARKQVAKQLENAGAVSADIESARDLLDPKTLTIGFARRFAEYKRAFLLFKDLDRLRKMVHHAEFPVQFIFAGKAHPRDNIGKGIIRDIITTIRHSDLRNHIIFLENYDMHLASYLVNGVDVWLNNPRRPREASGTSGMKAAANGVLNLSILDGWWDEAYDNDLGWAIGRGEIYDNLEEQDQVESESLYYLLEQEIMPTFYNRSAGGIPQKWVKMMKNCIQSNSSSFNTHRMVKDYLNHFYIPASDRWDRLTCDNFAAAKNVVLWKDYIRTNWHKINIINVTDSLKKDIKTGDSFTVHAEIDIDGLKPEDLMVQVYHGNLDTKGEIIKGQTTAMTVEKNEKNRYHYKAKVPCLKTGSHGFSVRILPHHKNLNTQQELGLIKWYDNQ